MTTKVDPKHIERIYQEMGYIACDRHVGWLPPNWREVHPPFTRHNEGFCFAGLPDPLADTPEGDHAWWEIVRHFEREMPGDAFRNILRSAVWDMSQLGPLNAPAPTLKAAVLAALADAIGETDGI